MMLNLSTFFVLVINEPLRFGITSQINTCQFDRSSRITSIQFEAAITEPNTNKYGELSYLGKRQCSYQINPEFLGQISGGNL